MKRIIACILAAAVVVGLTACEPVETTADPNITEPTPTGKASKPKKAGADEGQEESKPDDGLSTVTYKIGGNGTALITYSTPSGQEQKSGAAVPWKKVFKAGSGEFLAVSAQNDGSGTITCEIAVDGRTIKRSRSSGAYAIVSCDGMLGF